jgi:DNA mismatch repair protein MutS
MAMTRRGIMNYNVAVKEYGDDIIFLRRIVPGPSDRSYGIHVAKLAGLPDHVLDRAKQLLELLEKNDNVNRDAVSLLPRYLTSPKKKKGRKDDPGQMLLF